MTVSANRPTQIRVLLFAAFLSVLTACGGGGGSGSSTPTPPVNQSVAGIWKAQYTTTAGVSVVGILLAAPDGTFYSEAKNLNNNCADVAKGTLTSSGSTVSGDEAVGIVSFATLSSGIQTNCSFSDGSTTATATLSGSVVQHSTLTLTGNAKTANGTALPSSTVTLTFESLYNESSSLGKIDGNWTGPTGDILNINSSGALSSKDATSGCAVSGQASIINSSHNLYTVSATYSSCQGNDAVLNGLTATGLMTLDDTVSPNLLYVGYSVTLPSGEVIVVSADATHTSSYALTGRVQKGPFAIGSEITVNALNSTLSPTGTVYNTQTSDALGDFSVATIATQQVEIVAQGFYIDELTGQLSVSQIQLRAITDLSANSSPTVNVLTTLQEQRLKTLVSQGSTFAAADSQSQSEVLALFGINSASVNSLSTSDSMRIDGTSDGDAVLLAVSVILSQMATDTAKANGTTEAAELSNLVNTIAAGIASTGTLTSTTFIPAKNLANTEINATTVTANLQSYYSSNGVTVTAPPFIEWVDQTNSGVLPQRLVPVTGILFSPVDGD